MSAIAPLVVVVVVALASAAACGSKQAQPEATESAAVATVAAEPAATVAAEPAATAAATADLPPAAARRNIDARMSRQDLEAALGDPEELSRSARIVPTFRHGAPVGFKLYAIRPSSLLATLGLRNGDTIERVNGHSLVTPYAALDAYAALRTAEHFEVELRRRGEPVMLHIVIE